MKKIVLSMLVVAALVSCGGKDKKADGDKKETVADNSANPDYEKGLALVATSDCLTCHKIDEMLTGPSYRDIANKYAGADTAIKYLAGKIIAGGNGVWGETLMTPHAALSQEDAEAMAKYILLLKK
ncbi:MAG: c-type cytochrome [Bacteroidota bacterium]|nr:c-type cytochrome [Bacteroidota bacterium]